MKYIRPEIKEIMILELEHDILGASVVVDENYSVETVGQEVEEIPWESFTSTWE